MERLSVTNYPGKAKRGSTMTISGNAVIIATATTSRKKNGRDARATVLESFPLIVWSTNRLKPTGGDTSAISTTSTTKMPNKTRSKPASLIMGTTSDVASTNITTPYRV